MKNKFYELLSNKVNLPLQIVGTMNAYNALLAKKAGFKAIYLSGAGVANASYGLPDLGITSLEDICIDIRRITNACDLPLLVDIDTGFGGYFNIIRTIKEVSKNGASAVHIEDQEAQKRCGHRPNKTLVSIKDMSDRITACKKANEELKQDNLNEVYIIARTDGYANEGLDKAIERAKAYIKAGANAIFAEAMASLDEYKEFKEAIDTPLLCNLTEFGKTPLLSKEELSRLNIDMLLYPLSAFRAANLASLEVYNEIYQKGSQKDIINKMQTRDELYEVLDYHSFEQKLNELNKNK